MGRRPTGATSVACGPSILACAGHRMAGCVMSTQVDIVAGRPEARLQSPVGQKSDQN